MMPIIAAWDGRVAFCGWKGGYGVTIDIDHGWRRTRLRRIGNCASLVLALALLGLDIIASTVIAVTRDGKERQGRDEHSSEKPAGKIH